MRNSFKLLCKSAIVAGLTVSSSFAWSADFKFKRFFVLGDSLSDAGAYTQNAMLQLGFGAPNIDYKFTENSANAKVWAQFLGDKINISVGPNIKNGVTDGALLGRPDLVNDIDTGGTIYAEGGSRVSNPNGVGHAPEFGITTIPVTEQVNRLLADVGGRFNDDDLVAVWAGANDVFVNTGNPNINAELNIAANDLADQIDVLKQAGAKNVLVFAIPTDSLGLLPSTNEFNIYNNAMRNALADKDVLVIDFRKLVDAAIIDPLRYGYTAPNAVAGVSCLPAGTSSLTCIDGVTTANDGTYFRADNVHPTQQTHSNFADIVFATLSAASQQTTLAESTLSSLRQHGIAIDERMSLEAMLVREADGKTARRSVGDVQTYGSIQGGYFKSDSGLTNPGSDRTTQTIRFGADQMVARNVLAGVSFSVDNGQLEYNDNAGGFDSRLYVGTVYTNVAVNNNAYINASASFGYTDFYDINRQFNIGPSLESYDGQTDGIYKNVKLGGGYLLPLGNWRVNTSASISYESITVDGYTESFGAASLSYGENEIESLKVSGGLSVSYIPEDPDGWRPSIKASIHHELKDDHLVVNLGFDESAIGKLFLPRSDGTYGLISGSLKKSFGSASEFGINAGAVVGEDGETGVTGGVSFTTKF